MYFNIKSIEVDWIELELEIQKGYQDWIQNPIDLNLINQVFSIQWLIINDFF
jgi:hypothetical protein